MVMAGLRVITHQVFGEFGRLRAQLRRAVMPHVVERALELADAAMQPFAQDHAYQRVTTYTPTASDSRLPSGHSALRDIMKK